MKISHHLLTLLRMKKISGKKLCKSWHWYVFKKLNIKKQKHLKIFIIYSPPQGIAWLSFSKWHVYTCIVRETLWFLCYTDPGSLNWHIFLEAKSTGVVMIVLIRISAHLSPGLPGHLDDLLLLEVALGGGWRTDVEGLIRLHHTNLFTEIFQWLLDLNLGVCH